MSAGDDNAKPHWPDADPLKDRLHIYLQLAASAYAVLYGYREAADVLAALSAEAMEKAVQEAER